MICVLQVRHYFWNFRKTCLNIYHLDPEKFLSAPGLAWETSLEKTEVKLELLTDIDMLLTRLGFLKVVFSGGGGDQFDPPFHISRRTYLISI